MSSNGLKIAGTKITKTDQRILARVKMAIAQIESSEAVLFITLAGSQDLITGQKTLRELRVTGWVFVSLEILIKLILSALR